MYVKRSCSEEFTADWGPLGTGCQPTDLDVSSGAFSQLADQALGRVTVTWAWIS